MLDLHGVYSSGNTTALTVGGGVGALSTIMLGADGQTTAGVPIQGEKATLVGWGLNSIAADTIYEVQLTSQDQVDPLNGEWYNLGASSVCIAWNEYTQLPYKTGARKLCVRQNTGAGLASGWTLDHYGGGNAISGDYIMPNKVVPTITTFGGALTANTWGQQAFSPTQPIPNGKYAILGAYARAITNAALIRFSHPDFQGLTPGFPVIKQVDGTAATSEQYTNRDPLWLEQGYQFVYLSETLGRPCCPVFTVSNAGTGLVIQAEANTGDTPIVIANLARVG